MGKGRWSMDLQWPGLSLNWGRLHVSSLIYDWSNPQATVMSTPRCLPHSRPSLARSFWLKHQPARELRLAPKPESKQGPRFEFRSFCSPRFRLPWPVWLLFRARPPWRRDLSPLPPPRDLFNPFSSCGQQDRAREAKRMEEGGASPN